MSNSKQAERSAPAADGPDDHPAGERPEPEVGPTPAAEPTADGSGESGPASSSPPPAAEPGSAEAPTPESTLDRSGELEAAVEEQRERVLRLQADMENLRKRAQRDVENAHKFGIERFVAELLPVKDSMELGLQASSEADPAAAGLREGVELTLRMLVAALEKFGVAEVDPSGERFDPEYHQAISIQPAEGAESGTVLQVIQKGYTLSGRLVRPAMVIVAQ